MRLCGSRSLNSPHNFGAISSLQKNNSKGLCMATKEFTPEKILSLKPNEIYVFGSHHDGLHMGGDALLALEHFGAVLGKGAGLQGQSYAIPVTLGGTDTVKPYVDEFIRFAKSEPSKKFFVTEIGCWFPLFFVTDIAPLFKDAIDLENVILPKSFVLVILGEIPGETQEERQDRLTKLFMDTLNTIEENDDLSVSVDLSRFGTKVYPDEEDLEVRNTDRFPSTKISVTERRSFDAAVEMHYWNRGSRVAVLNFASPMNPGGAVWQGGTSQEESLCRISTLYLALDTPEVHEKFYEQNHYGTSLHSDTCVYTPGICIFKKDDIFPEELRRAVWASVDVITCSAPDAKGFESFSREEIERLHYFRGKRILDVALDNGVDRLILGAFGCGGFKNDPQIVAAVYAKLMREYEGKFAEVEFAIYHEGDEIRNYEAFRDAFETNKTEDCSP